MGEKSRGNWPVAWCSKAKECAGNCAKCVRKSEYRPKQGAKKRGKECLK